MEPLMGGGRKYAMGGKKSKLRCLANLVSSDKHFLLIVPLAVAPYIDIVAVHGVLSKNQLESSDV